MRNPPRNDALLTLAATVVAFLALDDITTDTASTFAVERTALAGCAVCFLVVAWRLMRRGHPALAGLSILFVVIAALAQPAIGPGTIPSVRWEYLATVGGLVWFIVLAAVLTWMGWRHQARPLGLAGA